MDFLLEALTNWLKEMLVGGIMSNLSGMFDSVNQQVADISVQVGQTPQGWNGSIFNMIENLSSSIMVPIAGVILAIVMTVDLIQMIADKNNLHDVDTWMIFKWVFKSAAAILIVTNTWNIVMGVFDMAQSVVAQAAGIINSDASIDISSVMTDLEPRLMEMDLGPLFGLWFQSLFIGITMWALYICIFIVIYGRMIEIYLVTSVAPVPMAAMMGKEWGGMGQNYLRSLLALGFQAFLIIVCVAIYAYEYTIREDIVMAMEELELTDTQAQALLESPSPLADVYRYFEKLETGYMDVIRDSIENRADDVCRAKEELRTTPIYPHSAAYASEHGEMAQYNRSYQANSACKEAIEQAISAHYAENRLDTEAAIKDVLEKFGTERVQFILANTIQRKNYDGRISQDNKAWAKTIPMLEDSGASRHSAYLVVDQVNPGLTDLFTRQFRKVAQEQQKSSVLQKLQQEPPARKPAAPKKREPER